MLIESYSISDIEKIADLLLREYSKSSVWLLNGEMGVGKTTLIKAICKRLEVKDVVASPTFSIVNEYQTANKDTIYHFDFYRIKHEMEALDIGADEYFDSGNLCLIEWSSLIPSLIPKNAVQIHLSILENNHRKIEVSIV